MATVDVGRVRHPRLPGEEDRKKRKHISNATKQGLVKVKGKKYPLKWHISEGPNKPRCYTDPNSIAPVHVKST